MVAKTHTDDPFWKFRDQPQEKVAISACCWPRNPSDIAERLYRRRRTATLLFILLFLNKLRVFKHVSNVNISQSIYEHMPFRIENLTFQSGKI